MTSSTSVTSSCPDLFGNQSSFAFPEIIGSQLNGQKVGQLNLDSEDLLSAEAVTAITVEKVVEKAKAPQAQAPTTFLGKWAVTHGLPQYIRPDQADDCAQAMTIIGLRILDAIVRKFNNIIPSIREGAGSAAASIRGAWAELTTSRPSSDSSKEESLLPKAPQNQDELYHSQKINS